MFFHDFIITRISIILLHFPRNAGKTFKILLINRLYWWFCTGYLQKGHLFPYSKNEVFTNFRIFYKHLKFLLFFHNTIIQNHSIPSKYCNEPELKNYLGSSMGLVIRFFVKPNRYAGRLEKSLCYIFYFRIGFTSVSYVSGWL